MRAEGGGGNGEPAESVHAFAGKDGGTDGEDDRQGADHERGVRNGGERKPVELDEELERHAEKRSD